jgi:rsbT co-antagonist protein RsbR
MVDNQGPLPRRPLHGGGLEEKFSEQELQDRKAFLQFTDEDAQVLTGVDELAKNYADPVVEDFYRHLMSFPVGQEFFQDRERLERVKRAQKAYFVRLASGHYDLDYARDRLRIGAVHERINLPIKSYLGMYAFYLRAVAVRWFDELDPNKALTSMLSLFKLVFLDMGLAIDTYVTQREATIRAQQEAIRELSTPVLQVREGLLVLPIVGLLDSYRALQLTEQLLRAIRANRARVVVVDVTGVPNVDSRVANHLIQTVDAARLMGAACLITGLSPEIAQALVVLGVDLTRVRTAGDLQSGLEQAMRLLGYRVVQSGEPELG